MSIFGSFRVRKIVERECVDLEERKVNVEKKRGGQMSLNGENKCKSFVY